MKLRALLAGGAVLAFAVLSLEAANNYVSKQAVEKLADAGGFTFERVAANLWGGQPRIVGVNFQTPTFSLHVGTLNLPHERSLFSLIEAAAADADSASAEDVTIEAGPSTYKIRRIDLSGSSLSTSDLAQILDPKNSQPVAERLAKISAASVVIPEIIAETKFGETTQKIVYRDISLNGVEQGKAATASASGASFSISDPQRGEAEGAYGPINAKTIDLVVAARILTQTRDQPDAPKLPLYDAVTIEGFHLANAEAQFALDVDSITAMGVKGRAPRKSWVEVQSSDPTPREAGKPSAFFAAILDSFDVDKLTASDIKLSVLADGDPARFTLQHASLSQLGGTGINALELQNVGFAGAAGKINAGDLTLRGVDFKTLDGAGKSSGDGVPVPNLIEKDLLPDFDQIILTKLDVDLIDSQQSERASDLASGLAFKADRLEIDRAKASDNIQAGLDVTLDHLTAALNAAGPFAMLAAMGYERLDLSSRLQLAWAEASHELEIKTFSLDGTNMGTLKIAGLLGNVTSDLGSDHEDVAAEAARNVVLKKLDLQIANAGLAEKLLAAQAKNQKKTIDDARHADVMIASLVLPALLGNTPPARALGSALAKFIADPKTFHLTAVSPQGFGLADMDLRSPGELFDHVKIDASANQ